MMAALGLLGLAGFVGAYEMADRMTRRTRHTMRIAVWLIAAGCLAAVARVRWPAAGDWALLLLLLGCGLYRFADRRKGVLDEPVSSRVGGAGDREPSVACGCPADDRAQAGDAGGSVVAVAGGGADDVRRVA